MMKNRSFFLALMLACALSTFGSAFCFAGGAIAADSSALLKKAVRGNAEAAQMLKQAADKGDSAAEYAYATYLLYKGDKKNSTAWLMKSARHGYPQAESDLGTYYTVGTNGVPKDPQKAFYWLKKAAAKNNPVGELNLGNAYYRGIGVSKDPVLAARWVKKAADQGLVQAQSTMGYLYERGEGVPQDYGKAIDLYQKAGNQGFVPAQETLGDAYSDGKKISKDFMQAAYWYQKAAEGGSRYSIIQLGELYSEGGPGLAEDDRAALKWLDIASRLYDPSDKMYAPLVSTMTYISISMSKSDMDAAEKAADDWWAQHKGSFN